MQLTREDLEIYNLPLKTEYPFTSRYIALSSGLMHYVDEGDGEPLILVHGTPSWSFEYRSQIVHLRDKFRCIAPDHLGFGLSYRPDDASELTVAAHRLHFREFIDRLGLEKFSLVV